MEEITTIGIDRAKNIFQVHAINAFGKIIVQRAFKRAAFLPFVSKLPPLAALF